MGNMQSSTMADPDRAMPMQESLPVNGQQHLELNPIDQTIARVYVRFHLFFPFEGGMDTMKEARQRVVGALDLAFEHWPFLAGQVVCPTSQQPYVLEVTYSMPHEKKAAQAHVHHGVISSDSLLTYGLLSYWRAPPSWVEAFSPDALGLLDHPLALQDPAMVLNMTFMPGGLALGFSFHHSVMDGPSIRQFLQVLPQAVEIPRNGAAPTWLLVSH